MVFHKEPYRESVINHRRKSVLGRMLKKLNTSCFIGHDLLTGVQRNGCFTGSKFTWGSEMGRIHTSTPGLWGLNILPSPLTEPGPFLSLFFFLKNALVHLNVKMVLIILKYISDHLWSNLFSLFFFSVNQIYFYWVVIVIKLFNWSFESNGFSSKPQ